MLIITLISLCCLIGCGGGVTDTGVVDIKQTTEIKTIKEPVVGPTSLLISHRGYNQNRIDGYIDAINDGFTIIETDLRLRNGEVVLLHDDVECNDCNTLDEILQLATDKGVSVWVEFKEREAVTLGLEILSQYNVDVVLSSFDRDALIDINAASNYATGFLTRDDNNIDDIPFIDWLIIDKDNYELCIDGLKCAVWTIKTQAEFDKYNGIVDALIMDEIK